jgi:hypothetical protein
LSSWKLEPNILPEIALMKNDEICIKIYIFKNWQEIILINKNLFLLTGILGHKSNENVRYGCSTKDFM